MAKAAPIDAPGANDDVRRFIVTVKANEGEKDVLILSGRAMSLLYSCMTGAERPQYPPAIEAEDIHNRVALALAQSQ